MIEIDKDRNVKWVKSLT